ncbi:vacuolar protein sorting-associated protein 35 [Linderina pennispora]|uniref:Vacuolar protein sorting-associated protein 35 n=1 Tax=Linderina pennispora TaxID=61395 RepID=A0A1Y1WDZ9_9FUNG|nr:vacuolar protein sorting-associated protein 35 [Linderina pennispora]ORX71404.1 vacuolar protein sorting-associated protein 35 [Linderina pennispora]
MNHAFLGTKDEQSKLLDDAMQAVKVQAFQMKRCVDNDRLLDGLKHCSTMLNELRTSSLTPKNYYELYLATFDALQYLTGALREAHQSGKNHLADLYELVQYAGNIVPRLYLMITIGSAYMSLGQADGEESVPMTKDYLPLNAHDEADEGAGSLEDSTHFILTNFVEMNKLWVRLQHQGLSRDREKREAERRDLRTLVGSNLLRLAGLEGIERRQYEQDILPRLLNQVVSCRDTLAQEYLMEALVQAFSDEWHLATIGQLMEAISALGPKVSIKTIVIPLVDRISVYAARSREERDKIEAEKAKEEEAAAKADGETKTEGQEEEVEPVKDEQDEEAKSEESGKSDKSDEEQEDAPKSDTNSEALTDKVNELSVEVAEEAAAEEAEEEEPSSPTGSQVLADSASFETLFDSFWDHVSGLIEARPDLALHDGVAICASMLRLSLACKPLSTQPVDSVLAFVREQLKTSDVSPGALTPATANQLLALLLSPLRAYASPLRRGTVMTTADEVDGITRLCSQLIARAGAGSGSGDPSYAESPVDEEDVAEEQGLLARLVHLVRGPDALSQLALLTIARDALSQGGDLIQYTYPAVIAGATRLLGPFAAMKSSAGADGHDEWLRRVRQLCRFIQATGSALVERAATAQASESALRLFVMAAQAAATASAFRGEAALEEAAYEFFVQAFTIYEQHVTESRAQSQALVLIVGALHATRNLTAENYDTLAAKCAQHGARLLRRPDQAHVACACAHLWWKALPDSELIAPPAPPGVDDAAFEREHEHHVAAERAAVEQHNNGDKALAQLQRALKVAGACLDPVVSVLLFVELLNQCVMLYERRCPAVTPRYVNDLVDLIRASIANIEAFDAAAPEPTRAVAGSEQAAADADALYVPDGPMSAFVLDYFRRTLAYIQGRKLLAASAAYLPDFSAIHCEFEPEEPEQTDSLAFY